MSILEETSEENYLHWNLKLYGEISKTDLKETTRESVELNHLAREMDQWPKCDNETWGTVLDL
jgi:hypothetical protein